MLQSQLVVVVVLLLLLALGGRCGRACKWFCRQHLHARERGLIPTCTCPRPLSARRDEPEPSPAASAGAAAAAATTAAGDAAPAKKAGVNLVSPREAAAKLKSLLPAGRSKSERSELLDGAAAAAASTSAASTRAPAVSGIAGAGGWTAAGKGGKPATVTRSTSEIKRAYGRGAANKWVGA